MIVANTKERVRFFRFAVVGSIGALVDFGILNLLTVFAGVAAVPASVVSFIAAVVSNFVWNRTWTYPDSRSKPIMRQLGQFFFISVIGLAIRTPMFAYLERSLTNFFTTWNPVRGLTPSFIAHNISLAVVILVVMLWNFAANRYWTFNDINA